LSVQPGSTHNASLLAKAESPDIVGAMINADASRMTIFEDEAE